MANAVLLQDVSGDVVDALYYCSDTCAKSNPAYAGWYGCVELDFGQGCDNCSAQLHGIESCSCGEQTCFGYLKSE
jgi:hypothetical protein